ncbi:MAG: hypothetical protein D6714_16130 [Bacteroidetes bacterium]|nr:MAG: hypothetical protein D6714_16130 [Bacteroidota bacterium]
MSCAPEVHYFLRNTSSYDQKVIISLGSFFEEQKATRLEIKYAPRVVKPGPRSHRKFKNELKPKYLNDRQLEVVLPGETTVCILAENPGFFNVIFKQNGQTDTLYYNQIRRWHRNGKEGTSFYFDLN